MPEDVGSLAVSLSLDSSEFNRPLASVDRNLKALGGELSAIRNKGKEWGDSLEGLRTKQEVLGRTLSTQETKVKSLREAYEKSVREKGADAAATETLAAKLNRAVAEYTRTETEIEQVNSRLAEQEEALRQAESNWGRLETALDSASSRLDAAGEKMTAAGEKLTVGVTAPILGLGGAAIKTANDFDTSQGRIQAQLGLTEDEAEKLNGIATDLWKNAFGESIADATESLSIIKRNMKDIPVDQLEKVAEKAFILQDAFGAELVDSTKVAQTMMTNFGISADEAFDLMTRGFQEGGDYSGELLDTLNEYSPQFSRMGHSAKDMLNILIAGAEAGAFNLDKVGDAVKEFNIRAKDGSKTTAEGFEAIGLNAKDMGDAIAAGGDKGKKAFEATIAALVAMEDPVEQTAAGVALFGTQWEDLESGVIEAMGTTLDQLGDVEGATQKAGDALYNNLGSRATSIFRDFQEDLLPVGEELIDLAEEYLPKVADVLSDVTEAFGDLSPEAKETALKIAGVAAAAGPALIVAGTLTTGLGTLTKAGSGLVGMLGKVSGPGLLGRVGLMGLTGGPVGLAIAGVGGLALGLYALNDATNANIDETQKSIEKRGEEIASVDEMIGRFEDLQTKNKLSTDEVLRYMDVMDDLKGTKSEEAIQKLTEEQDKLLSKSGLTNEEMIEFLGLNDQIVEKTPATAEAISEQGNAYAEVLDEVKKLNEAERARLTDDTYLALTSEMDKQRENLAKQSELQSEIEAKEIVRSGLLNETLAISQQIRDQDLIIAGIKADMNGKSHEERTVLAEQLVIEQDKKLMLESQLTSQDKQIENLDGQIGKKKASLDETNKELSAYDELAQDYAAMVLYEQGIVAEKGKANEALQQQQSEIDAAKAKLRQLWEQGKINKSSYDEQNASIQSQQGKIDVARQKLEEMNKVAGRTIYKDLYINEQPKGFASYLNTELGRQINKNVVLKYNNMNGPQQVGGFATGTRYAPGGLSWVGEEGPELMYVPNGARVIPANDSEAILNKWNVPTGNTSTTNSVASVPNGKIQPLHLTVQIPLDGRSFVERTIHITEEMLQRNQKLNGINNGEMIF